MATKKTTAPAITFEMIETKTWKGGQSVNFRQIAKLGGHKIKIDIDRDSYASQSHARGYVFNMERTEWVLIYSIPSAHMKTTYAGFYDENLTTNRFTDDVLAIKTGLISILF